MINFKINWSRLILFLILSGCAVFTPSLEHEYNILLFEQQRAQAKKSKNFDITRKDVLQMRQALYQKLASGYSQKFTPKELIKINKALFQTHSKKNKDLGTPVFHHFHGNWKGTWEEAGEKTTYHHTWYPPQRQEDLIVQKVIIGKWNHRTKKRENEIAAINTYNLKTGYILGAVDIDRRSYEITKASHIGFYVDPYSLIWIARFGDDVNPYYSFYYEHINKRAKPIHYHVKGIGFHWNRGTQKIFLDHWKEGNYYKQDP